MFLNFEKIKPSNILSMFLNFWQFEAQRSYKLGSCKKNEVIITITVILHALAKVRSFPQSHTITDFDEWQIRRAKKKRKKNKVGHMSQDACRFYD